MKPSEKTAALLRLANEHEVKGARLIVRSYGYRETEKSRATREKGRAYAACGAQLRILVGLLEEKKARAM